MNEEIEQQNVAPETDPIPEPVAVKVNLTRDEYHRYATFTGKIFSAKRRAKLGALLYGIMAVMTAGILFTDWQSGYAVDPAMALCEAMLLLGVLNFLVFIPRRTHFREDNTFLAYAYDDGAVSCFGRVSLDGTVLRKKGALMEVEMDMRRLAVFAEMPDMMILIDRNQQGLCLPARCMTPALADAIRKAADSCQIPQRRFDGRLVPQGQVIADEPAFEETPFYENAVQYTREEIAAMSKENAFSRYTRQLFTQVCFSGVLSAMVWEYRVESWWLFPIAFFLLMGLNLLLQLVFPLSRIQSALEEAGAVTFSLRLSDRGLSFISPKAGKRFTPWCVIDHIINGDDSVDFVFDNEAVLRLPKRCIDDLTAFDGEIAKRWRKQA